jgi:hypothetical protein
MRRWRLVLCAVHAVLLALGVLVASAAACEGAGEEHAESTTLSTKLSGESKEGEEITVLEGSKVKDKATLSGKNASKATGKVAYKVYSDKECKTLVTSAGEVTVSGESVPASSEEALEGGKTYYWQAHYGGDSKNAESTSPCTEILTVKAKTTLSTKLAGESKEAEGLTVQAGSKVKDTATLSGTNSATATGKVLYKVYSDKECTVPVKEAGEVTLESGAKIPASTEEELEAGKTYYWQAIYKGDTLHQETTSTCGGEVLNVEEAAAPTWIECGALEEGTYENSACTKEHAAGSFEWLGLAERQEAATEGTLEIADEKGPTIKCDESATGSVGTQGEGEISSITFTACEVTATGSGESSCIKGQPTTLKALDLPWQTALEEEGAAMPRDSLTASGKGPGLAFECTGEKSKVTRECFGATSTSMANNESEGSVKAEFESKSAKMKCKEKEGEASAELKDSVTIAGVKKGLNVFPDDPQWWINMAAFDGFETFLTRTILATKVTIKNANLTVECKKSTSATGQIFRDHGFELRSASMILEECTVTNPADCKVSGRQITLNRGLATLRWKEARGEEAVLQFFNSNNEQNGTIAEFGVENETGGMCAVSHIYKLKGAYVAEIKNSTTEETHKKFATGALRSFYDGAAPNRTQTTLPQVQLGPAGGLVNGEITGEYEFTFNGALSGKTIRIKAAPGPV